MTSLEEAKSSNGTRVSEIRTMADFLAHGSIAPAFEANDQEGNVVRLQDLRGRPVVLYFYPEDDTPGCTREACAFRDDMGAFQARGAIVVGVSPQDEASHRAFREKYSLTFPLLADTTKRICRDYRALGLLGTTKRVTYVIGPDGVIRGAFRRIDPKDHSAQALRLLEGLPGDV